MSDRDVRSGQHTGGCCWCEAPADSDEDVISKWVEKVIVPPALRSAGLTLHSYEGPGSVHRWRVQRLASKKMRVRAVCQGCNNGWMSQLERRVQPILAPLIEGHEAELTLEDQLDVALWACVKSCICDVRPNVATGGLVSVAGRRAIYTRREPPSDMMVLLAAYERADEVLLMTPFAEGTGSVGQPLAQWVTTMVIGHLVVQVQGRTGTVHPAVITQMPGGVHDGRSFTVWPPQPATVRWPPRIVLTRDALKEFCSGDVPGIEIAEEAFREDQREPCSQCGARHDPVVRSLPVTRLGPS